MIVTLNITGNNITYKSGDSLLIKFPSPFRYVTSISDIQLDFSPLDTVANGHNVYIRWTYDIAALNVATGHPNISWSAWELYSENGTLNPNAPSIIAKLLKNNSFDLEIRLVRHGNDTISRTVNSISIDVEATGAPETPSISPFDPEGCNSNYNSGDPYMASSCNTTNFCNGINLSCDPNLVFRPYDMMNPAIALYKQMSCTVSEMFGHCVRYFKTKPKLESADTTLKEYSLFTVDNVKDIKILVPDNEFPSNAINFLPFDMDFEEGMEIHIVKEHFQRAFGFDRVPEEKDYLYFPLLDRMFEVSSAYLHRDFMMSEVYYKIQLYKWQDKVNVIRDNPEIAEYVDNLTNNFTEILQPEIDREFEKITKPDQYQTISIGGFDHVRSLINYGLEIEVADLTNYFTVVAKYYYLMNKSLVHNLLAVRYKLAVNRKITDNTGFSFWFNSLKTDFVKQTNTTDTLLRGYNDNESKGYEIKANYGNSSGIPFVENIQVKINNSTLEFTDLPTLTSSKWYGIIFNHMNEFSQGSLHIWEMKYNPLVPGQNKTTDLKLIYTKNLDIIPEVVDPTSTYFELYSGTYNITNLRIWKESIEEEKQPLLLNQYVVRDNDLALLIDNSIPPLRQVREYVR